MWSGTAWQFSTQVILWRTDQLRVLGADPTYHAGKEEVRIFGEISLERSIEATKGETIMKVIIVGGVAGGASVRRACAGWMKKLRSSWWSGDRMFPMRTAGFPTISGV